MIYRHKKTGQYLKYVRGSKVKTLLLLDDNMEIMPETNKGGRQLLDVFGNKRYRTVICREENLIKCTSTTTKK